MVTTGRLETDHIAALEALQGPVTVDRRCETPAELLAVARHSHADAVLIIGHPEILTDSLAAQMHAQGLTVVAVTDLPAERERLRRIGVLGLPDDTPASVLAQALQGAAGDSGEQPGAGSVFSQLAGRDLIAEDAQFAAVEGDPMPQLPPPPRCESDSAPGSEASLVPEGVTVVWGPHGAPGRTTVAITLASELALRGAAVLLVDADSWAASAATHLGLLEESAGLAQACRAAERGGLDVVQLARLAQTVRTAGGSWDVLTGLPRPERWAELRSRAVGRVLSLAAERYTHVIVDVAAPIELDEELSFDTAAPQRSSATVASLEAADQVLLLGGADPLSFSRLIRAAADYPERIPGAAVPTVVVNQLRSDVVGRSPQRQLAEAWARYAGGGAVAGGIAACLPYDREACDTALRRGEVLAECAPESELRRAVAALVGVTLPRRRRWGRKK
ncbi:P-loop NTPase [Nesterenkonia populi]